MATATAHFFSYSRLGMGMEYGGVKFERVRLDVSADETMNKWLAADTALTLSEFAEAGELRIVRPSAEAPQ